MAPTEPIKSIFKNFKKEEIFVSIDYNAWERKGIRYYFIYACDVSKNFHCSRSYPFSRLVSILNKFGFNLFC